MKLISAIVLALCISLTRGTCGTRGAGGTRIAGGIRSACGTRSSGVADEAELCAAAAKASKSDMGHLTVLGDSIASGYGLPGYESGDAYSAKDSFANMLGSSASSYGNFAVDGRRSDELLSALVSPSEELEKSLENADTVIVSIGGNDFLKPMFNAIRTQALTDTRIIRAILNRDFTPDMITEYSDRILKAALAAAENTDTDKIISNVAGIVERVRAAAPDARIILLTVYDPFAGNTLLRAASEAAENKLSSLNAGIKALEGENIDVADVYKAFKGHESEFTNINKLDIHPSAAGHRKIYGLLTGEEP